MARIRKKAETTPAKAGTKMQLKWVRSAIAAPVKQKLVIKGLGLYPLEPGGGARRHAVDPRDGGQGAAPGGNR